LGAKIGWQTTPRPADAACVNRGCEQRKAFGVGW
jgi:hypothetical protein